MHSYSQIHGVKELRHYLSVNSEIVLCQTELTALLQQGQVSGPLDEVDYASINTSALRQWHRKALQLVTSSVAPSIRGITSSSDTAAGNTNKARGFSSFSSSINAKDRSAGGDVFSAPHARAVLSPLIRQAYVVLQLRGAFLEMNEMNAATEMVRGRRVSEGTPLVGSSISGTTKAIQAIKGSIGIGVTGRDDSAENSDSRGISGDEQNVDALFPGPGTDTDMGTCGISRIIQVFEELTHTQSTRYDSLPSTGCNSSKVLGNPANQPLPRTCLGLGNVKLTVNASGGLSGPENIPGVSSNQIPGSGGGLGGLFSLGTGFSSLTALLGSALPQEEMLPGVRSELMHVTAVIKYHAVISHFEHVLREEHPHLTLGITDISAAVPLILPRIGPLAKLLADTRELLKYDGELLMSHQYRKKCRKMARQNANTSEVYSDEANNDSSSGGDGNTDDETYKTEDSRMPRRVLLAKGSSRRLLKLYLCAHRLHELLVAVVDDRWGLDLTYPILTELMTCNLLANPSSKLGDSQNPRGTDSSGILDLSTVRSSSIADDILARFLSSLRQQEVHTQHFDLHKEIRNFHKVRQMLRGVSIRKSVIASAFMPANYYDIDHTATSVRRNKGDNDGESMNTLNAEALENWETKAQDAVYTECQPRNNVRERRNSTRGRRVSVSASATTSNSGTAGSTRGGVRRRSLADIKNNVNHHPAGASSGRRGSISQKTSAFTEANASASNAASFLGDSNSNGAGKTRGRRGSLLSSCTSPDAGMNDNKGNQPPKLSKTNKPSTSGTRTSSSGRRRSVLVSEDLYALPPSTRSAGACDSSEGRSIDSNRPFSNSTNNTPFSSNEVSDGNAGTTSTTENTSDKNSSGSSDSTVVSILCRTDFDAFPANVRSWFELARDG